MGAEEGTLQPKQRGFGDLMLVLPTHYLHKVRGNRPALSQPQCLCLYNEGVVFDDAEEC